MTDDKRLNNIDKALTPRPAPDLWDEVPDPSDPKGKFSLASGQRPDRHYADAHAVGAALRERRQGGREKVLADPRERWFRPVGQCDTCERFVTDWHNCPGVVHLVDVPDLGEKYHAALLAAMRTRRKGDDAIALPDVWRAVAGYPAYVMHCVSREVWRTPRDVVLPNGAVRHYPGKEVIARRYAFSLTVDGHTTSRGVYALWCETFPEFSGHKRADGVWDDTVTLRRSVEHWGVPEWMASNSVHTT